MTSILITSSRWIGIFDIFSAEGGSGVFIREEQDLRYGLSPMDRGFRCYYPVFISYMCIVPYLKLDVK